MATRPEQPPRSPFAPPLVAGPPEPEPEPVPLAELGYSPDELEPIQEEVGPIVSHWTDSEPASSGGAAWGPSGPASPLPVEDEPAAWRTGAAGWGDPFALADASWGLDAAWARPPRSSLGAGVPPFPAASSGPAAAEGPAPAPPERPFAVAPMPSMSTWLLRRVARGSGWLRAVAQPPEEGGGPPAGTPPRRR